MVRRSFGLYERRKEPCSSSELTTLRRTLYVRALAAMQEAKSSDASSYFQIAGKTTLQNIQHGY